MKKFIKIISVLCLGVFVSLAFLGCSEKKEDKFYEQTNIAFNTFITNVCENTEYSNGLTYGSNVNSIIYNTKNNSTFKDPQYKDKLVVYTQLEDVYDKIFVNSFKYLSQFKNVFNLTNKDKIDGNTKKLYQKFEQDLLTVTEAISLIKLDVVDMDNDIGGSSLSFAISNISIHFVKEFKLKYIALCEQLIKLCEDFLYLCENYIYSKYDSFKINNNYIELTNTQLLNQRTISTLKCSIKTLTPAIKYLDSFGGEYVTVEKDKIFETLDKYLSLDFSNENTITIQELDLWNNVYKAFLTDTDNFYLALENVSMYEFKVEYNLDSKSYLAVYPENNAYLVKILEYINSSVSTLYNFLEDLFA